MTVHGSKPFIQVSDSNGNPYVGAKCYVYEVNSTTLRSIYSDTSLSVSITNPLTSDAAGNFDRFYQAAGQYKLRVETSTGTLIWQWDYIDSGLPSGGVSAFMLTVLDDTTAAAARTTLDVPSNTELSDLSAQISSLSSQIQNVISIPQGYLTLTSLTPSITGDVSAGTSVYYTPDTGSLVPIYNGTSYVITSFSELTMAMDSNHVASTLYDFFVINDAGTTRLVTGPAWNTSTAGSCARGTGAGTTELERLNGIYVNKNDMTARYGATTVSVSARRGTYVGSMFVDGTNGQVTCHRSVGQSRKWGIWNLYNKRPIVLQVTDSTASWAYSTNTIRQSNGAAGNKATIFTGLQDSVFDAVFTQKVNNTNNGSASRNGIGVDSTTAFSGENGYAGTNTGSIDDNLTARYISPAAILGISNWNCLEAGSGTVTTTFSGTSANMNMSVRWMG